MATDKKNILVIGGGAREAAIVWKLAQSPRAGKIWCAPGNAGMSTLAERVNLKATDLDGICEFAQANPVDLVFVAPDDPLALGLVDRLREIGVAAFGPSKAAARLEASKDFAKQLMATKQIPTADFQTFENAEEALQYLESTTFPTVIKADGLALGKGVLICKDLAEAKQAVDDMLVSKVFGDAGSKILVEEFLEGEEVTIMIFTDGESWHFMPPARDYKRALENQQGLNTGGMGAICPSHHFTEDGKEALAKAIVEPALAGMREAGCPFEGVLYLGLMLTQNGPKVIEFNARFGDPETQVVLPLLKTDLLEIIEATLAHRLGELKVEWLDLAAACVVLASGGYPEQYEKGIPITGLEKYPLTKVTGEEKQEVLYTAGVDSVNGNPVTSGGRVLSLVTRDSNLALCLENCYRMADEVQFRNMHYRRDIGS